MHSPQRALHYANHYAFRNVLTWSEHQGQAYPATTAHGDPSEVGSKVTGGNMMLIV